MAAPGPPPSVYDEVVARLLFDPLRPGRHRWRDDPPTEEFMLTQQCAPTLTTPIRRPRAAAVSYDPRDVAKAYGAPVDQYDGSGVTVGIVELGGAVNGDDLAQVAPDTSVVSIAVDDAVVRSDGPDGADGEVMLDVEVVARVAPGAAIRVYFGPNTDKGFLDAITRACDECDYVSISWGGPESTWGRSTVAVYAAAFAATRAKGVTVFVASGDTGSRDGTSVDTTDYPASDPNVVGCGGTKLLLNSDGSRASEVTWDDDDRLSATGGGTSKLFPGRQVPDVAGNASPSTGYQVLVDGDWYIIGGTSGVAPLYAGCAALLRQAYGQTWDFVNTVQTNPTLCYDVTIGDNGSFKAGPGRDLTTGFGVVDFGKMLAVLTSGTQIPAPGGGDTPPPTPEPEPEPVPDPEPTPTPDPGNSGCLAVLSRILRQSTQISAEAQREIDRQSGGRHGGGRGKGHGRRD